MSTFIGSTCRNEWSSGSCWWCITAFITRLPATWWTTALSLPAQLPGTHWVMFCMIRCLALTVSGICLKLGCFQSTSTYSVCVISLFMHCYLRAHSVVNLPWLHCSAVGIAVWKGSMLVISQWIWYMDKHIQGAIKKFSARPSSDQNKIKIVFASSSTKAQNMTCIRWLLGYKYFVHFSSRWLCAIKDEKSGVLADSFVPLHALLFWLRIEVVHPRFVLNNELWNKFLRGHVRIVQEVLQKLVVHSSGVSISAPIWQTLCSYVEMHKIRYILAYKSLSRISRPP